jgi:SAM-dependent methyltransferase
VNPREYEALFEVEDRHWWFVLLRREIARALERHRPSRAGDRWLDAGSGTGGLLANLRAGAPAFRVGLDSSLQGLWLARSRKLADLAAGSVAALPFPPAVFGLITSIDVLCHRDVEEEPALSEMHRCLQPGGLLILQVPAFSWLFGEHDRAVWTNRRFRRGEVERLLEETGFGVRESFYRMSLLFPAAVLRRLWTRRPRTGGNARSDVRAASAAQNALLGGAARLESALAALGPRLPFGLSIFCVAEKRAVGHPEPFDFAQDRLREGSAR